MAVAAFPAPPFVASPNSQLKSGVAIRPSYNVTSLAELDNSPWLVAADGKGRLSVWNLGPDMDVDTPDFVLQAHSSAIHTVVALQSGRLQEVIEELHWPAGAHRVPRKVVLRASPPREDVESVSTAASEHRPGSGTVSPGPRQLGEAEPSPAPPSVEVGSGSSNTGELEEAGLRNRGAAAFLRRLCCCLCNKADGTPRHWRRRKFRRVQKQHWLVATAGEDGWIKVWRLRPREDQKPDVDPLQADFITEWSSKAHAPVTSLLELHDGLLVFSLAGSPDVRILDPVTVQVKSVLFGHVGQVLCLAACADGRLVTGGADGSVRLWAKRMWSSEEGDQKKAPETTIDAAGEGYPSLVGVATLPARKPTPPPSSLPPMIPALGWAEEDQKEASAGVSNTAFFAHMQQADKGESCNLALRVYVHSAEGLPRAGLAEPYVHCYVQEGVEHIPSIVTTARTSSQPKAVWNERCKLVLRRGIVEGEWQLPECSWLTCQLFLESKSRQKPLLLLGHWSEKLQLILQELARSPSEAAQPRFRKLYAPPGEGPYMELQASVLHVGFEQMSSDCLECVIASADGLPQDMQGSLFVRMHINQSMPGRTRRVPPMHQERTRVVPRSSHPCFDEVLVLDVPVHLCDQRLNVGADLHLHVEVYDAASLASEDLLGTMSLPLDAALKRDGEEPKQYNLTIAPGALLPPAGKRKDTDIVPASKLILGFQALMPCPMQLRCVVDHGNGLPTAHSFHTTPNRDTFLPMVRMSFVEGNPLPAQATVTRTMTWRHTMKKGEEPKVSPVWDEQLFLPLPSWIWDVSLSKAAPDRERPSVREGWEHADSHTPRGAVVCADLYDCDALGVEKFLGRAVVPFDHAFHAASSGSGSKPRAVTLTCLPDSYLWMGFGLGGDNDHFVVALARAEDLPVDPGRQEVAISCVVRITELGAFGRPTDKADLIGSVATATTLAAEDCHPGKLVWQHEEILELPGAAVKSSVAARPNWYLQFEVLDSDPRAVDDPPLAVAAAPLSDVLNQSWEVQAPEKKSSVLQKRIANMRAPLMPPKSKVAAAPGTNMAATEPIVRELPVLLRRTGLEARDQPRSPGRSWKEEFKQRTRSLTQLLTGKSEETLLEAAPVEVVDDGVHNDDRFLIVQFEVLSRWQGTGGGAKCAPTRPMHGPSPVRSLVPLVSSVVAGHENGNIFVWDVTGCSAIPLHQFQAHKVSISCMLHMPAIDCLITAAMPISREEQVSESLLRVWSSSTLDLRQTVPLHGAGKCLALIRANEKGSIMLALGKETRQSCQLQLYHLDAS